METKEKKKESWLSVIGVVLIALLVRTFIFEPYSIPSGSMKPNFLVGDYLFVSKYTYGVSNASLPLSPNLFNGRILALNMPQRGDVMVFKSSHERYINYIKRLIGMPGDEIQVKDGTLYINGQMVKRQLIGTFTDTDGRILKKYLETLPNGVSYSVLAEDHQNIWSNTDVYKVPDGHYFMMGDNRDHSIDSRAGDKPVGFIPYNNIIGKAEIIIFSNPESLIHFWKWPFTFNNRFLLMVK